MEKTIKISGQSVRLNNNIGWTMVYRDQFGRDIVPSLIPMAAGALDIISGLIEETRKDGDVNLADILRLTDGETLINAIIHLGGLEFVDLINITWSLAKCADDDIDEPREWIKQFETFPVDVVAPAVGDLIIKGVVSSKNLERLKETKKALQPKKSHSTRSSSEALSEG